MGRVVEGSLNPRFVGNKKLLIPLSASLITLNLLIKKKNIIVMNELLSSCCFVIRSDMDETPNSTHKKGSCFMLQLIKLISKVLEQLHSIVARHNKTVCLDSLTFHPKCLISLLQRTRRCIVNIVFVTTGFKPLVLQHDFNLISNLLFRARMLI